MPLVTLGLPQGLKPVVLGVLAAQLKLCPPEHRGRGRPRHTGWITFNSKSKAADKIVRPTLAEWGAHPPIWKCAERAIITSQRTRGIAQRTRILRVAKNARLRMTRCGAVVLGISATDFNSKSKATDKSVRPTRAGLGASGFEERDAVVK